MSDDQDQRNAGVTPGCEIQIVANGPMTVTGDFVVEDMPIDGATTRMNRAAFCRCGQSKRKPFCDNSHRRVGFCEPGVFASSAEELLPVDGPVRVTRKKTGSLKFHGPVKVISADGKSELQSMRVKMCRCGLSKTMPFCDDAHRDSGFDESKG